MRSTTSKRARPTCRDPGSEVGQEFGGVDVQSVGKTADIHERYVSLSSLDSANVRTVEAGEGGELLLREAGPPAPLPQGGAETFQHGQSNLASHGSAPAPDPRRVLREAGPTIAALTAMRLRTISIYCFRPAKRASGASRAGRSSTHRGSWRRDVPARGEPQLCSLGSGLSLLRWRLAAGSPRTGIRWRARGRRECADPVATSWTAGRAR